MAFVASVLLFICIRTSSAQAQSLVPAPVTDAQLLRAAADPSFRFFRDDPAWLPFTPGGGGHRGWVRIRFNEIAFSALDSTGALPGGSSFPDGSLVVKEIRSRMTGGQQRLAIMLKKSDAPNSNRDWVWGEYEEDGRNVVSAADSGRQCIRCHSITSANSPVVGDLGHRDFVRTFGLRP